jgi:tRNA threonylcarbamoyladenosine biosynthesis protein TsaE
MSPILHDDDIDFLSHGEGQTQRLGERLGPLLQPGDVVCLQGPLGSGKTRFAQGIGRGMGIMGILASPTYTIVNEYRLPSGPPLFHIDFYRLHDDDFPGFDPEEYIGGSGVAVVEWPERAEALIPPANLWLTFRHVGDMKRGLLMRAHGERYRELLRAYRRSAFGV